MMSQLAVEPADVVLVADAPTYALTDGAIQVSCRCGAAYNLAPTEDAPAPELTCETCGMHYQGGMSGQGHPTIITDYPTPAPN